MGKFKAIDLFCGAGGLSYGLKKAGFDVCVGLDIDEIALTTYRNNLKNTKIINDDIKKVSSQKISEMAGIKKGDNFLLAGCPPCQGFSSIGKRDENDIKNELVYEYARIIMQLEPSFILMENVPGMSRGVGKKIFANVINLLEEKYYLEYETLNAADYGVPQIRKRLVLHGIRYDVYKKLVENENSSVLKLLPVPTHSKEKKKGLKLWKTVGEAIMDLPKLDPGEKCDSPDIYNHVARKLSDTNIMRLKKIRELGGTRTSLPEDLTLECHKRKNVSYTDTYGIMDLNKPSPTITSGCTIISKGRFGHPTQNRAISVREAARLQSFDDKFIFYGSISDMSLQIGNAVPPILAAASGRTIYKYMKTYQEYLCNN